MKNYLTITLLFLASIVFGQVPGYDRNDRGQFALSPDQLTLFNTQRVENPVNILDIKHISTLNPNIVESLTASGGTVTLNKQMASADMAVTTTIGSRSVRQSKYTSYQSGASLRISFTGAMNLTDQAGVRTRIGLFDDVADKDTVAYNTGQNQGNGVFFQYDGADWSVVKRSGATGSQVDSVLVQSNWLDPLDGTGASGLTLDPTKVNIFIIEIGWLGAKGYRASVLIGGKQIIVANGEFEGKLPYVFMQTASLPVRYEIEQIAGTGAATMRMVCSDIQSYGPYDPVGYFTSIAPEPAGEAIGAAASEPILSIRLDSNFVRRTIKLRSSEVIRLTGGNGGDFIVRVWVGGSLTGASWVDVGGDSGVEYDITATTINTTAARCIYTGLISGSSRQSTIELLGDKAILQSAIDGTPQIITIEVYSYGADTYVGSLNWFEIE